MARKKSPRNILREVLIRRPLSARGKIYKYTFWIYFLLGIFFVFASYGPSFWYFMWEPDGIRLNARYIKETILAKEGEAEEVYVPQKKYIPPFDPNLPEVNTLIIPSIKVESSIVESPIEEHEEALRKGIWRVTNFGTPEDDNLPIILAAHRFGYLAWTVPYRFKNSFYNLAKSKEGDIVQIVWKQRKYTYSIYKEELGEEISDYTADLILYTCQDLDSSVRIFRYAKLLEL